MIIIFKIKLKFYTKWPAWYCISVGNRYYKKPLASVFKKTKKAMCL